MIKNALRKQDVLDGNISVLFGPVGNFGFGQTQDILGGVGRSLAAYYVQEVQTGRGLIQALFVTGRITQVTAGVLLDQGRSLGIVLFFSFYLFHGTSLLSLVLTLYYYTWKNWESK